MSRFPIIALLALALAFTLAACGNKGPLVRPSVEDVEDVSVDDPALDAETSADEAAEEVPVEDADVDDDASTPPADPNAD
ncbi:hypothetical protein FQY83_11685 [Luteimonas marina]|uniref:Sugar transporter n=1 Tax=Luteimonas marina TaxID=488485 RepID=A0A5C5U376_9GAMM|nr:lipoprotein [Luteimonas marina]TWT20377.1 hypothetical protein FQY83_11685 [Luteimonas marina]